MKILTFTLTFLFLGTVLFGQNKKNQLFIPLNDFTGTFENKYNNWEYKSGADSVIFYADSLKENPSQKYEFKYEENKLIAEYYEYEKLKGWEYSEKFEFFMDNTQPDLKYESFFHRSDIRIVDGNEYSYHPSIGDSVALHYTWDTIAQEWRLKLKHVHHISEQGVNLKSNVYIWNDTIKTWTLTAEISQDVLSTNPDTIKLVMSFPGSSVEFGYTYIFVWNDLEQIIKFTNQKEYYKTVDSLIYKENGQKEQVYFLAPGSDYYDYIEEYQYDEYDRLTKVKYFYKSSPEETSLIFSHMKIYYYPEYQSSTEVYNNNKTLYRLYPNPVYNNLNIANYKGKITITNLSGKVIIKRNIELNETIDISNIPDGFYLIVLGNNLIESFCKL
jgi:hypothetical protein